MLVSMILRLVDEMTGPLKAAEAEVKNLEKTTEQAAAHSQQSSRITAAEFRAMTEGKKVAANNSAAAVERMSVAEFRAMEAAKVHAQEAAGAQHAHTAAVNETTSAFSGMAEQIVAVAGAYETLKLAQEAWKKGAEAQHVDIGMEAQGLDAAAREMIHKRAAELSGVYKLFSQTEIEKLAADATPILGSATHALEFLPDLLKMKTILQARDPHGGGEESFNQLIKGFEVAGYAQDPEKLHHVMDLTMKAMNAFSHTLNAEKYGQFFQFAGPAAKNLSDEFMKRALPTLLSESAGSTVGQQVQTLMNMAKGGHMMVSAAKAFYDIGMVTPGGEKRDSKGKIIGVKPGGLEGLDLLGRDPARWLESVADHARNKGMDEKAIEDLVYSLFPNRNLARLASKATGQSAQMDKDEKQVEAAPGLEAWATWMKDSSTVWKANGEQFDNLLRGATESLQPFGAAVGTALGNILAFNNAHTNGAAKTTEVGGAIAAIGAASLWAFSKGVGWFKGFSWGGAGTTAAIAETPAAAETTAAAAGGGSWLAGIAEKAGPIGAGIAVLTGLANLPAITPESIDERRKAWRNRGKDADIDTTEIDAAKDKATDAGQHIQDALNITAKPNIDSSGVDALTVKLREALAVLSQLVGGISTAKSGAASLGAQLGKSTGALHDGYVTEGR